jgi:hypothetical protein
MLFSPVYIESHSRRSAVFASRTNLRDTLFVSRIGLRDAAFASRPDVWALGGNRGRFPVPEMSLRDAAHAASCTSSFFSKSFRSYSFRTLASQFQTLSPSNSFAINRFRTLCKIPGIGYPPPSLFPDRHSIPSPPFPAVHPVSLQSLTKCPSRNSFVFITFYFHGGCTPPLPSLPRVSRGAFSENGRLLAEIIHILEIRPSQMSPLLFSRITGHGALPCPCSEWGLS